ncbi:MAG: VIT domain-containing protein [Patescibacteria group bacterium]
MQDKKTPDRLGQTLDGLPLKQVRYKVTIVGLQSAVTVEQEYGNDLDHPVEAIYICPLPAEASVLALEMQIGDRKVTANLRQREEARQEYAAARDAGHHTTLLEQERENVFTMNVGGIEPGEKVIVSVTMIAPVDWQDGGGRFMAPLVVAPRFIPGNPTGQQGTGWADDTDKSPDASKITPQVVESVPYTASIALDLSPGFAAHVECPSHPTMVEPYDSAEGETQQIKLTGLRMDRDFILTYRTQATLPTVRVDRTTFIPNNDDQPEEFVLLQLTPGASAVEVKVPLDVILVLDKSGSMYGGPIAGLKRVANKILDRLMNFGRSVRVGIVIYNCSADELLPLATIGQDQREKIQNITASGGTDTPRALKAAMQLFGNEQDGRERCIVLVTDAMVDTAYRAKRGVRIHVVGIGTAVNDELARRWSRETGGGVYWTRPDEDFDAAATAIAALASGPVVIDVALQGLPTEAVVVGLDDLYAGCPRTIAVKLPHPITKFTVTGKNADGQPLEWPITMPLESTTELGARLWAKAQIREVQGEKQIALSLRYNIICGQTAFVAVSIKEQPGGKPVRVDIPVLLPEGWNLEAVFGSNIPAAGGGGGVVFRGATLGVIHRLAGSQPETYHGAGSQQAVLRPKAAGGVTPTTVVAGLGSVISLLTKALALLAQAKNNALNDAEWQTFSQELNAKETAGLASWSEDDKAQLFVTLVELGKFGYKIAVIPKMILAEPKAASARVYWIKARQLQGYAVTN